MTITVRLDPMNGKGEGITLSLVDRFRSDGSSMFFYHHGHVLAIASLKEWKIESWKIPEHELLGAAPY